MLARAPGRTNAALKTLESIQIDSWRLVALHLPSQLGTPCQVVYCQLPSLKRGLLSDRCRASLHLHLQIVFCVCNLEAEEAATS